MTDKMNPQHKPEATSELDLGDKDSRDNWLAKKLDEDFRQSIEQALETEVISASRAKELLTIQDRDNRHEVMRELWGLVSTANLAETNVQEGLEAGVISAEEAEKIRNTENLEARYTASENVRRITGDYQIIERALEREFIDTKEADRLKALSKRGLGASEITDLINLRR